MVVGDFYVPRTIISPAKADSPLIIDPDTVLASPIATEFLQAVPRRNAQVVQILRRCRAFAARLPRSARTSPQTCGTNFAIAGNSLRVTSRKAITTPGSPRIFRRVVTRLRSGCCMAHSYPEPSVCRASDLVVFLNAVLRQRAATVGFLPRSQCFFNCIRRLITEPVRAPALNARSSA
jgi:hypothetical protein